MENETTGIFDIDPKAFIKKFAKYSQIRTPHVDFKHGGNLYVWCQFGERGKNLKYLCFTVNDVISITKMSEVKTVKWGKRTHELKAKMYTFNEETPNFNDAYEMTAWINDIETLELTSGNFRGNFIYVSPELVPIKTA